ncbi:MAG: ABC transporter permease [Proteobacteria bacterium]|nr:MAG: ABC transporter permease [Pseudomonadota bacterium]
MIEALIKPFGIDLFCVGKKFLVYNMVGRNLKIKYRRSVLGILWTLLSPLSLVGIYYFVFKTILKVESPNYLAYLVSGILPWAFFSQTILEGMESISGNSGLVSKIPVPLQVFPLVGMLTNLVTLIFALPIMITVSVSSGILLGPSLLLLPVYICGVALISYTFALSLGLMFVYFQDLKHITGLAIQLWFYATPVLYHSTMIPAKYGWILYANPVATAFIAIHQILTEGTWPPISLLFATFIWTVISLIGAITVYRLTAQDVAENV